MKKLAIFSLIAALCLALSGCKIMNEVSHYFAGVEDFIRGNPKPTASLSGGGGEDDDDDDDGNGGGGDPEPHWVTIVCFKRPAYNVTVTGEEPAAVEELGNLGQPAGINFAEVSLFDGDYTLEFETGQKASGETEADLDTFAYPFKVNGSALTIMLVVNENANQAVREVRVIELPGAEVAN